MATRLSAAPLVGRAGEQARLEALLGEVEAGDVRVLELSGEPGIGKSRMLAELAAGATQRVMLVLAGRAEEFERDLPHAVLIDALDDHLAKLDPRRLRALDAAHVRELAAIFPALSALAEPGAALAAERYRAHRAVIELLEWLAFKQPLGLMLDDMHWADPASIELLAAILRRPPAGRVLLALAHRTMKHHGLIASAMALAEREGVLERIELGPLAPSDAAALVGDDVPPRARAAAARQRRQPVLRAPDAARPAPRRAPAAPRRDCAADPARRLSGAQRRARRAGSGRTPTHRGRLRRRPDVRPGAGRAGGGAAARVGARRAGRAARSGPGAVRRRAAPLHVPAPARRPRRLRPHRSRLAAERTRARRRGTARARGAAVGPSRPCRALRRRGRRAGDRAADRRRPRDGEARARDRRALVRRRAPPAAGGRRAARPARGGHRARPLGRRRARRGAGDARGGARVRRRRRPRDALPARRRLRARRAVARPARAGAAPPRPGAGPRRRPALPGGPGAAAGARVRRAQRARPRAEPLARGERARGRARRRRSAQRRHRRRARRARR